MTYFTVCVGRGGGLCECFDLIDGVGLHAQIRRLWYWSCLRWRGEIQALEPHEPHPPHTHTRESEKGSQWWRFPCLSHLLECGI